MDIKEIAQKVRLKMQGVVLPQYVGAYEDYFAAELVAEIQRQSEPVAEINAVHLKEVDHWCKEVLLYSGNNPFDRPENRVKLFTFPPSIEGERQKVAAAIAEYFRQTGTGCGGEDLAKDVESGEWRKFYKGE